MPHRNLWRLKDGDGSDLACELEPIAANRLLLTVTRNGAAIVTETFADKRDALARSVGLYKELKAADGAPGASPDDGLAPDVGDD